MMTIYYKTAKSILFPSIFIIVLLTREQI